MERFGADALELCCFTPIGTKMENLAIHPDEIYEMIRQVTQKVSVPVMVRLPHHAASSREFVQAVERAGAKAVSAIETLSGLIGVDVERGRSRTPTIGGYSGPHIRPVSLAATAMLSQLADCQIASMGGVEDALSALEFLMLGASVVQLGSAVLLGGYGRITRTVEDLEAWMRAHRYGSVEELRGIALDSLSPFEEILTRRLHASLDSPCGQSCGEGGCPCVTACLDGAVVREGDRVRVVRERCSGCGLCVSLCPGGHFSLRK